MTTTNTDTYPAGRGLPITSFNDIASGRQFPPERERGRISQFDRWYRWSRRSYVGLLDSTEETAQLRFDVNGRRQTRRLAPNLFRFVMDFWGDAVAVDAPVLEYEGGGRQQEFLDALAAPLMRASRLVVMDMIRYGCGVFWSRRAMRPESLDPRFWFPVRPAHDEHQELGEVVAFPFSTQPDSMNDRLFTATYRQGGAEGAIYALDGLTIGPRQETATLPFAVGSVVPVRSREGFYGTSDFEDMAEYVAELHRRETSISEALDRHTRPHLAVPEGSLSVNADGSVTVDQDGMVIPVPEGGVMPQYVTWDASFEAQERSISHAEQRILRMASIAPILATPGEFALRGGLPSGAALRRLSIISVQRLKAIREELTQAWKRVIPAQVLLYAEDGEVIPFDADRLNIEWPPEFSTVDDELEGLPAGADEGGEEPAATDETRRESGG